MAHFGVLDRGSLQVYMEQRSQSLYQFSLQWLLIIQYVLYQGSMMGISLWILIPVIKFIASESLLQGRAAAMIYGHCIDDLMNVI